MSYIPKIQPQIRLYFCYFANSKQRYVCGCEICLWMSPWWSKQKISWNLFSCETLFRNLFTEPHAYFTEKILRVPVFWNPILVAKYIVAKIVPGKYHYRQSFTTFFLQFLSLNLIDTYYFIVEQKKKCHVQKILHAFIF